MLNTLALGVRQLIFPDNCLLCRDFHGNPSHQLCPACHGRIDVNLPPFCAACSVHLAHYSDDGLCSSCRGRTRHWDRAWAACLYTDEMRRLLHLFKYSGKTSLHKTFIPLMTNFIRDYNVPVDQFDAIVPIPLHPVRLRERGYNQSEILSRRISLHYGLPHRPHMLVRTQFNRSQTHLDQKQRWTNLDGNFKINPSENAADMSILLVDDLLTTGATADAAADALKEAGAAYVGVLTLAIAV